MQEIQILNGIPKIIENAKALYDDANLLYENNRFERAYSLYQLSIEETAKALFLLTTILFDDLTSKEVQKRLKMGMVNHKIKIIKSIALEFMLNSIMKEINLNLFEAHSLELDKEFDNINEINDKKNYGLYTSFIDNRFRCPTELINKEDVIKIKSRSYIRVTFGEEIMKPIILKFDYYKHSFKKISIDKECQ